MTKPLILRDEIHGDISLGHVARAVVDHPSFQRLRYIKQLGLAEFVFPCATHTRFQHSLGAAHLAGQYYESLVETWPTWEFEYEREVDGTQFLVRETRQCVTEIAQNRKSREFWEQVTILAAMLHDVGHGPWSHTFEYLDLPQNFQDRIALLSGPVRKFFDQSEKQGRRIYHEEVSLLYIHEILSDLERLGHVADALGFFLPVAVLVNKRILSGDLGPAVQSELESSLRARGIAGGMPMLRLLAPLISGPFDVDRADYIQRDGRNCGVSLGGIEWDRIVRKLMPCLARHANDRGEPSDVVLVSHLRTQHVLDDFIFSLFQMYTQVYLHPKTVAFEEQVRRELETKLPQSGRPEVTFDLHKSLSDESFRIWLEEKLDASRIRGTLFRQPGFRFGVVGLPVGLGEGQGLAQAGYQKMLPANRPMLKDSVGVFLFSASAGLVVPWKAASPVAENFSSIQHSSEIWIRPQ
ncbi:HD domain-containing protein [bacterium]|nr:HD domain-containing protein [bacterium]